MHHSFDINIAIQYGIEEAILIHHFQYWISYNKRLDRNFIDGRTWSYQTQMELVAHFPYFKNRSHLMRVIKSLTNKGVLIKGNYNKSCMDKTIWYAFNEEEKWISNIVFDCSEMNNGCSETNNAKFGTEQPIPDTKPNTVSKKNIPKGIQKESPIDTKIQVRENVLLKKEEHEKLLEQHPKEFVDQMLDTLSAYKESSGRSYKSDYGTMCKGGWVYKKILEEKSSSRVSKAKVQSKMSEAEDEFYKKYDF